MAIGANVRIRWKDSEEERDVYFSFGVMNFGCKEDSFGVDEDKIFFYCPGGEAELKSLDEDFVVLSYDLVN